MIADKFTFFRFSRMAILCMHRFFDRAGSADGSPVTPSAVLPSDNHDSVGTPEPLISRLNSPACTYL